MTKELITESNKLVALFMGGIFHLSNNVNFPKGTWRINGVGHCAEKGLLYNTSWDWLMPAIQKFDRLYQNEVFVHYGIYQSYCDDIDDAVTQYEILPAFEALVSAITWYNKKHEFVYKSTFPPTVLGERALDENFFKNY
jgi:hypothetical protein